MKAIVHPSQLPAQVELERADCLRQGIVAAKFHYQTKRQSDLWLELHRRYAQSKSMTQPYADAAQSLAADWPHPDGTLIALGCGGGKKDVAIFKVLPNGTRFLATDVSKPLVLEASQRACEYNRSAVENPLVFDLATADDLPKFLGRYSRRKRIFTFFGVLPNFPPEHILPQLRLLLKPGDQLVLSANLAPNGMENILQQYNNQPTRDWLAEFPRTHGAGKGEIEITARSDKCLRYAVAHFVFLKRCVMEANGGKFAFQENDRLQLFVSYRYTIESLTDTLESHGIGIRSAFQSANGEEGVFLCSVQ